VTWKTFLNRYERFTDILCAAAKNGCSADMESEYDAIRRWFNAEYCRVSERLRPYLLGISAESWSIKTGLVPAGRSGFRRVDVLESLFKMTTLQQILDTDKGDLIDRVSLLSDAVYQCDTAWK